MCYDCKIIILYNTNQIFNILFLKKIETILKYIENKGITLAEFERKGNIANGYLTKLTDQGKDISPKLLEKIRLSAPEMFNQVFGIGVLNNAEPVNLDSSLELQQQNQALLLTIHSALIEIIAELKNENSVLVAGRQNKVLDGYLKRVKKGGILEEMGIGGKVS